MNESTAPGLTGLADRKATRGPNLVTPNQPIVFDEEACHGCKLCVEACPIDVLAPQAGKGTVPLVLYPDECWYCGCCEMRCPEYEEGAIRVNLPLMQRARWKRQATGEHFRLGMKNPPPPNTRPPV